MTVVKVVGDSDQRSCTHCLNSAHAMSFAEGARRCYCKLTKSLSKSVKGLMASEFARGCCRIGKTMKGCGDGCGGHDHGDHGHDHSHSHDHDHDEKINFFEYKGSEDSGDLEEGYGYSHHLALGISGMHCSSCAVDIEKIIKKINGVDPLSVRVNFVMNRGECKFDPEIIEDPNQRIRQKILSRFNRLDIVILSNTKVDENEMEGNMKFRFQSSAQNAAQVREIAEKISGVVRVSEIGDSEIELLHDPDRIGIRNILAILEQRFPNSNIQLSNIPDGAVLAQASEKKYLRNIKWETIFCWVFTIPVMVTAFGQHSVKMSDLARYSMECACATMVLLIARKIYIDAFRSLRAFQIDMDVLVSISTGVAYIYSVAVFAAYTRGTSWGTANDREPFFETSTMLTSLILSGRWMTAFVRAWANSKIQSIGDSELQASEVRLWDPQSNTEIKMDAQLLHYGDIILASPGEKIATDGLVLSGRGQMDESHLTGEPKPQTKEEGGFVLAGSKIISGDVRYRVSKLLQENTISNIKNMVNLASQQKPRAQVIADKIAAVLTPVILGIALAIFLGWLLAGTLAQKHTWGDSLINAITYGVATLAISCPCAIGLAVPMVLVFASRSAINVGGFVFRNPAAIEKGLNVGKVCFDKTGTLTTGKLAVEFSWIKTDGVWRKDPQSSEVYSIIRMLCHTSSHPMGKAILLYAETLSVYQPNAEPEIITVVSQGMECTIDGSLYRGGRLSYTSPDATNDPEVVQILSSAQSVFTLSKDGQPIALFGLKDDTIRPEVPAILNNLRARGIQLYIFSGDRTEAVLPVAQQLGIPTENVFGNCCPEDKRGRLENLKEKESTAAKTLWGNIASFFRKPQRKSIVFVGDGSNDAVALMAADIGVSLSHSTDMASNSADVAIISDSIVALISFLDLAKRVVWCIRMNFVWAIVWNLIAILGTSGAWKNVRIPPQYAGLGEIGSVLPVFIISLAVGLGYKGAAMDKKVARAKVGKAQ